MNRYLPLLAMILAGVVLGYTLSYIVTTIPVLAPAGHREVAAAVTITDTTANQQLALHYMGGVFSISMPSLNEFPSGHNYAYSRWEFDSSTGVEAFMVIAGPGVDGKTYGIEISRKCWDALSIQLPQGAHAEFEAVTAVGTVSPGYVSFEYIP